MSLLWTKDGTYRLTDYTSESDLEAAINQVKAELFGDHRKLLLHALKFLLVVDLYKVRANRGYN